MSARSLSPVDLRRRNPGPSLRGGGGGPCRCTRTPGCDGRPVTGSHSPPREEEFSHRLTQQGSQSLRGEVSVGPSARMSEECNRK